MSQCALCLTGDRYVGEWKQGKLDGRGICTFPDNVCFVVPFGLSAGSESLHCGLQERHTMASGRRAWQRHCRSQWYVPVTPVQDSALSPTQCPCSLHFTGYKYDGDWKENKRDGRGVETWSTGMP